MLYMAVGEVLYSYHSSIFGRRHDRPALHVRASYNPPKDLRDYDDTGTQAYLEAGLNC